MNIKQIIEHAENEIAEGSRGRQYIIEDVVRAVLELVEKELPEIEKRNENVLFSSNIQDHLDDAITAGKEKYKHQVSTIINSLKV